MAGLAGIFIAAMMVGVNSRVGVLALADVRGALGFGVDEATSWLHGMHGSATTLRLTQPSPRRTFHPIGGNYDG